MRPSNRPAALGMRNGNLIVLVICQMISATMLMRRVGRSHGFAMASLSAVIAVLVAAQAFVRRDKILRRTQTA